MESTEERETGRVTSAAEKATLLLFRTLTPWTSASHPFSRPHPLGLEEGDRWSEKANHCITSGQSRGPVEGTMRCVGSEGENGALQGTPAASVKFLFCSSAAIITTHSPANIWHGRHFNIEVKKKKDLFYFCTPRFLARFYFSNSDVTIAPTILSPVFINHTFPYPNPTALLCCNYGC